MNKADNGACSYYRAVLPTRHCAAPLAKEGIDLVCSDQLTSEDDFDCFIFHRIVNPVFMPTFELLKKLGKKLVIELDDDLWHIPAWNPASSHVGSEQIELANKTLRLADEVWTSTPELAAVVGTVVDSAKVKILPNLIDPDDYPEVDTEQDDRIRIMWAGSVHHDADLEILVPVVERVIGRFGNKVEFLFFGNWPEKLSKWVRIRNTNLATSIPREDLSHGLSYVDPVDLKDYPATLCGLAPHVGLCPLVDVPFNHSKSGIKQFEYALSGAATVATALPPYRSGILLSPTAPADDWVDVVTELVENEEYRKVQAEKVRGDVLEKHSWRSPAKEQWLDAFRKLVADVV